MLGWAGSGPGRQIRLSDEGILIKPPDTSFVIHGFVMTSSLHSSRSKCTGWISRCTPSARTTGFKPETLLLVPSKVRLSCPLQLGLAFRTPPPKEVFHLAGWLADRDASRAGS